MENTMCVLMHALIIDGKGGDALDDGAIVYEGDRIVWVGSSDALPMEYRELPHEDVKGQTVMPGLIDTHVHFLASGRLIRHEYIDQPKSFIAIQTLDRMKRTLENGVTTARDLGGIDSGIKRAVNEGLVAAPHLSIAVQALSTSGSHQDLRTHSGYDDVYGNQLSVAGTIADGPDEWRRLTRQTIWLGADVVKVMASGGVNNPRGNPSDVGAGYDELRAIVIEAESRGKYVAAHAQNATSVNNSLRAGVRTIEHGYGVDDEGIDLFLENDAFLVPTLLPSYETVNSPGLSAEVRDKMQRSLEIKETTIRAAIARGVKVAMGTDAGVFEHGNNLRELALLVDYGMTPEAALAAATTVAAELLGQEDEIGTLEAGKRADLLIVGGDPRIDISILSEPANIKRVIRSGVTVKSR